MTPELPSEPSALAVALHRFEASGSPTALDQAFLAAGTAIAVVRGERRDDPSDATEARELLARLPEPGWRRACCAWPPHAGLVS
jgi:hypothetical protein